MTIIDDRKIQTTGDLVKALAEFPHDSPFEVIFKLGNGHVVTGYIDTFSAVHISNRGDGEGNLRPMLEIVVQDNAFGKT